MTKPVLCAALAALTCGAHVTATAQESDRGDSAFEEITVTAKKREQSIYEVPVAVSAFSGATIARQGITDLTDVG